MHIFLWLYRLYGVKRLAKSLALLMRGGFSFCTVLKEQGALHMSCRGRQVMKLYEGGSLAAVRSPPARPPGAVKRPACSPQ